MAVLTVSSKGQLVIPVSIRKSLGIRPKTKVRLTVSEDNTKAILEPARKGEEILFMSQINLCEVYYKTIRLLGKEAARKFLDAFQLLPITVIHPTDEIIWKAAEIKADQPISLADCFATATALEKEAVVITGDPDFRKIEHIIPTEWM